jgi:hypothetical protein
LILAWVVFPVVVAALGSGWGVLIEKAAGANYTDTLLIPLGLAGVLVVAGLLTAFASTAPAATPVVAAGAGIGLVWGRPWRRLTLWPALAAVGVLLAYGAPVLLSGQATFLGYLRLDDTATWFGIVDNLMAHGRSVAGLPQSTYTLVYSGDVGPAYPLGAFAGLGVSRALVGVDVAWVFQPYLACCAAAIALCISALAEPFVASPRRRALVAFLAAQPALLYGYSLWGGIKELTAALLVVLGAALAAAAVRRRPVRGRELLGLGIAAGALAITLSVGAVAWMAPAFALLVGTWLWRARQERQPRWWRPPLVSSVWLIGFTAACSVPLWVVLSTFLSNDGGLFSSGQTSATRLGNLIQPLSGFQLAGIWTIGDFRLTAGALPTAPLVGLVIACALVTLVITVRRGDLTLVMYAGVALVGCALFALVGSTPWVMGKALAISSPALLAVAVIGVAALWGRRRWGALVLILLGAGVIWSNALGYHDALLAPRARLAELQHIGGLLAGRGPTFVNDYEPYADRHFLRAGAPVEPAEYRVAALPLTTGVLLVKTAYADLDSFPLSTLLPYRSIVTRNSPVESRPPSIYKRVWAGTYYDLWQRPANPTTRIILHVPLGDQRTYPYCGSAENGAYMPLCSIAPAAVPACSAIEHLGHTARRDHAQLVAYQRPLPIVIRGDDILWPATWLHDPVGHTLTAIAPGTAIAHIEVAVAQQYRLWLAGSFTRGFEVTLDGHSVGQVKDEISDINGYVPVTVMSLSPGVHTLRLTYPHAGLTPGSGNNTYTSLSEIALQPLQIPVTRMLRVTPAHARSLCGRPLDWIEITAENARS